MFLIAFLSHSYSQVKRNTALQMLLSGRKDLVPHALQLLPASKVILCDVEMVIMMIMIRSCPCADDDVEMVIMMIMIRSCPCAGDDGDDGDSDDHDKILSLCW